MINIIAFVMILSFPVTYSILFPWWRTPMGRMMFFVPFFLALYLLTSWPILLLMTAISVMGKTYCVYKTWERNPK